MADTTRFPTVFHRWLALWVLRVRWPRGSMEGIGFPFLYTLVSSVLIYGVAMVIFATHPTSNTAKGLATAIFVLIAVIMVCVSIPFILRLLFMPLNVERDPLSDLLDVFDVWFALINGLTSALMVIFLWAPSEFAGTVPATDPPYRAWLKLLFAAVHDFHSAGFGMTQADGDWALIVFIVVSYAGRIMLVLAIASLARLMSRNIKRFPKRYLVAGLLVQRVGTKGSGRARRDKKLETRFKSVGMDRIGRRKVSHSGALRGPSTTSCMQTPDGNVEIVTTRGSRKR